MIGEKNHIAISLETGIELALCHYNLKTALRAYFYCIERAINTQFITKNKLPYRNRFCMIKLFIFNRELKFIKHRRGIALTPCYSEE